MLDQKDIQQIGEVLDERLKKSTPDLVVAVGEMLEHNVLPQIEGVGKRLDKVEERLDNVGQQLDKVEQRITKVEATMVTKEYLDEKLGRLKGDLVVEMRGFNHKLSALVGILRDHKVISDSEAKRVLSMEPFPELSLL